jgi:MoxR-like ATPase
VAQIQPVFDAELLAKLAETISTVHAEDSVLRYVQRILAASRESRALVVGASTRAGLHLLQACRGWAALMGRDFVTPDDVKELSAPVLAHRLVLQADAQVDGLSSEVILADILTRLEVPR